MSARGRTPSADPGAPTNPSAPRDRVMENLQASKILPAEIGIQKRENVNLFMRAMGLDVDLLG